MIIWILPKARGQRRNHPHQYRPVCWRKSVMIWLAAITSVSLHIRSCNGIDLPLRRAVFKRAVTNLVANATRYARRCSSFQRAKTDTQILIHIDDNGPGIAQRPSEKKSSSLLSASTMPEPSMKGPVPVWVYPSPATSSIAHGGQIILDDSRAGRAQGNDTNPALKAAYRSAIPASSNQDISPPSRREGGSL